MDFKLDETTWDFALDSTGNLQTVTGREAIAQHVKIRLRFFRGEWALDTREGTPYWEQILIHGASEALISEIFRRVVAETPGIASVRQLGLSIDRQTRTLTVARLEAVTTDGELITADDFGAFVLGATELQE
jgi:hypothetical protein